MTRPALSDFDLAFADREVEAAWQLHSDEESRNTAFRGMLVFAGVLLLGAAGDWWQAYEGWREVAVVRLAVWSPIMFLGAWVVSQPGTRGHVRDVVFAVTVLTTISLLGLMLCAMPRQTAIEFPMYWSVLLLLVHVLTPLGMLRATLAGTVIVSSFFTTMLWYDAERGPMAAHTVFLLFAWAQLIGASWLLERQYRRTFLAQRELAVAREQSERLLRAVLPVPIAERLKSGEEVIADEIPDATVLFADLVGFTELSRRLTAPQVVAFLDALFTRFDALAVQHGVDKVKTIGDAYMCVSGTTGAPEGAAARVAALALDLNRAVLEHAQTTGTNMRLRIGLHRGPLVAGIIGRSRFTYDLWGDTVNQASRMESHGEPGAIQVSAAVAQALGDRFILRQRGVIQVKGVGPVETWWLDGER